MLVVGNILVDELSLMDYGNIDNRKMTIINISPIKYV